MELQSVISSCLPLAPKSRLSQTKNRYLSTLQKIAFRYLTKKQYLSTLQTKFPNLEIFANLEKSISKNGPFFLILFPNLGNFPNLEIFGVGFEA